MYDIIRQKDGGDRMEKTEKEIDEAIEAFQKKFALRLSRLRTLRKVSAREMSLALGQSNGYINNIETGGAFPSLKTFYNICEYLHVSPQEFFEEENDDPERLRGLIEDLKKLDSTQLKMISDIVKSIQKK